MDKTNRSNSMIFRAKQQDLIFNICVMAIPILQFLIFYVGVNFNSFMLSFQEIDAVTGGVSWSLQSIEKAYNWIVKSPAMWKIATNSLVVYAINGLIATPLGLLFSFYIAKRFPMSKFFRVVLFLPSIISGVVFVSMFDRFVNMAIPDFLMYEWGIETVGLLSSTDLNSVLSTLIFFSVWISFGGSVLIYSNAMSGISNDVVEAAHLDGATGIKEFWYVDFPLIFPTFSTFYITGVVTLFTNQVNLFTFYGAGAPGAIQTFGYWMFARVQSAKTEVDYPVVSAMGLLQTIVAVPLTFFVKWLLEKVGPSTD